MQKPRPGITRARCPGWLAEHVDVVDHLLQDGIDAAAQRCIQSHNVKGIRSVSCPFATPPRSLIARTRAICGVVREQIPFVDRCGWHYGPGQLTTRSSRMRSFAFSGASVPRQRLEKWRRPSIKPV